MADHIVAEHNAPSEATPLLTSTPKRSRPFGPGTKRKSWQRVTTIINLMYLTVLLFSFGDKLSEGPLLRVKEAVICYRYYERIDPSKLILDRSQVGPGAIDGVFETLCKVDEVQNDLASLNGWQTVFDGIPGLLLAIPLGWAADKFGRWPVAEVGIITLAAKIAWMEIVLWFWQTFDIHLTWLSSVPMFFSGGNCVVVAMIFVTLSDITPETERANVFIQVAAFNLSAALLMPPLASWLMVYNPWIPSLMGLALMVSACFVYLLMPETLDFATTVAVPDQPTITDYRPTTEALSKFQTSWKVFAGRKFSQIKKATGFLSSDWRILILMPPFVGFTICAGNVMLLLQYTSKRYSLALAQSNLLYTIYSGAIVVVFLVLIPQTSSLLLRKTKMSGQRKDLYLGRASALLMAGGWTLIGLAPNIPSVVVGLLVAAMGQGGSSILRSFLVSLVSAHHIGRTFSVLGIAETLGIMAGGPVFAKLYKVGLDMGGGWIGLPFVICGTLMLCGSVLLFLVGIRPAEEQRHLDAQRQAEEENINDS